MRQTLAISILSKAQQEYVIATMAQYFGDSGAQMLYDELKLFELKKGETLMNEGDEASEMYILLSGSLDASIQKDDQELSVGRIERGESVGEMALLGEGKRSATIRAHRNSLLLQVDKALFDRVSASNSTLAITLSKVIIDRLDRSNKNASQQRKKSKFISLIGLNLDVSLTAFTNEIKNYWKEEAKIAIVQESEHSGLSHEFFSLKINDLEHFDYVFLLSSKDESWNNRISRNCDKTVFVGMETDLENIRQFKKKHGELSKQDELVLIYEQNKPEGVEEWLNHFPPNKIFRKRLRHEPDERRLARIICEEQICLVFGGGGAHGLANIGVVKSLLEHGIPIDVVGGTSIGSLFSGALAQDWDYHSLYKNVKKDISNKNPLNDYTFPFVALIRGKKMLRLLKKHFNIPIEHTWKNFFCVASNLSTSSAEIMEEGPMNLAIASSVSIPGILPPRLYRRSLLIDGGVINNLPADIMVEKYNGHVITVDVVSSQVRHIDTKYRVGNWQYFKNVLSRNHKRYVPNTMNTLMKAVTLASVSKTPEKEAVSAYYIRPRIKKGFLDWKAMTSFVKEGYNTTNSILRNNDFKTTLNLPRHLF
jgi:predicted acylesterase/phospholipase RssA/CRP-like cAMP-binding protein